MSDRRPRRVSVVEKQVLTPQLLRLVLEGDLADYPQPQPAAHFKLLLPRAGQDIPQLPDLGSGTARWAENQVKPWLRAYTVRAFDRERQQLTVDLVVHSAGPATEWARQAVPGSQLAISPPGGPSPMLPAAACYWLAGDLSAVPAIGALLENLPADARGEVWLLTDEDVRSLLQQRPQGVEVHWVRYQAGGQPQLIKALQARGWPAQEDMTVWVAGEHHEVVALRDWLRLDCGLPKARLYAVPYWKKDADEETYHQQRHDVMDQE